MNFKDIDIKISYLSTGEDSFSDILNPLLSYTKIYKRSVGFFSSSALNFIGDGILEMARKGGKIYLATSPQLTDEDICAIQSGYLDREKILRDKFLTEVQDTFLMLSDDNAKMLYSLVKEGIVDVKIVVRRNGMYHDKLAILEDFDGNVIACVGSNNETASGYNNNYEKTRVYKSWCDFEGRIQDETSEFNSIWEDNNSELIVFNFMDAFQKELLERVEKKGIYKPTTTKYKMRDYQIEAKEAWNKNHAGFFVMATGTGKTITALYSIKEFITTNKIFTVIAVPYKHLVAQWVEDVKVFFPDAYICIVHGEVKDGETKVYACYLQAQIDYKPIIVITTIKSFFLERYTRLYNNVNFEKLLVVDEAHNFINRISDDLDRTYRYKLGLSATPVFGNDENKTRSLLNWFGGQVVDLPIEKALGKYLVNYEYHPIFVHATAEDEKKFSKATALMLSGIDSVHKVIIDEEKFTLGYRGRLRAISMAEEKISQISSIFSNIKDKDHTIIYCSDGKLLFDSNGKVNQKEEIRHLEYILRLINNSVLTSVGTGKASKFTASEDIDERMSLIDSFNKGYIEYLVAIRCLDEGINIPSIKSALILSSNDNYREFVQRRGRILRQYPGKTIAHIYDVIVLPSFANRQFAEIELRRFYEYCRLALNNDKLIPLLEQTMAEYGLNYDDIKFKNEYVYGGDLDD